MKSNRVLLGLFAGILTLAGGHASAQFYEIGPANIGGHVSSLVIDHQDNSRTTIYAGSIAGGLYVHTSNSAVLQNLYAEHGANVPVENLVTDYDSWHYVVCKDENGNELPALPISTMMQGPDGTIFIGTGDNAWIRGSVYANGSMSIPGRGIYRYSSTDRKCRLIPTTDPEDNSLFDAVRALDFYQRQDTFFLFAATSTGLYRWTITSEADWSNPVKMSCIKTGSIDNIVVARSLNIAYFTSGNQIYKVSNAMTSDTAINISASNADFGKKNSCVKLALAPSDNRYLYAMIVDSTDYRIKNILVTTNGQQWDTTTTESIMPLNVNLGSVCGTILVNPDNPKKIIAAASTIWIGEGFIEGANYMWTKTSQSESELNYGDFMGYVYNNSTYVHSGIHQIVSTWSDANHDYVYYIATDGGVFKTQTNFNSYEKLNRGLNISQINSIDVSPDGSIISGAAYNNACPFIEARMDHQGGSPRISWYDYGTMGNLNHDANILWTSTGRQVAASSFQQIIPQNRRNIFVSSNGFMGRSYADYLNYNNTTTWTVGQSLLTKNYEAGGPGNLYLWESNNDTYMKDSITITFDLRGTYTNKSGTVVNINQDPTIKLKDGDKAVFVDKTNSDYPFEFEFKTAFLNQFRASHGNRDATVGDTFVVKNPIVSRLFAVSTYKNYKYLIFTWMPNDFTRVYDETLDKDTSTTAVILAEKEKMMKWAALYELESKTEYPRCVVMTPDGRNAFFSTYNTASRTSLLRRINGFDQVNFHQPYSQVKDELNSSDTNLRKLTTELFDTLRFQRPISCIAVDPRPGHDRVVLAFEDYNSAADNIIVINNATTGSWTTDTLHLSITGKRGIPVYSAIIEDSTGNLYAGTSEGVFIYDFTTHTWSQYEHLKGLHVTSIVQQTKKYKDQVIKLHNGIDEVKHIYAKTKWPRAIYFGTYGRGIFMDNTYVTDLENEVYDPNELLAIPTVSSTGTASVSIYPNPVSGEANISVSADEAGNAMLRIYDINGRCVMNRTLGHANIGEQVYTVNTTGMSKGMYLVNVTVGGHTAATKMIVR